MTEIKEMRSDYLTTLCRICAKHSDNTIDLFNAEHNNIKFVEMLAFCLQQIIHESDGLPGIICEGCGSNLIIVHSFHTLYNNSEQHFRQILSSSENKVKVEIECEPDEPCGNQIKVENEGHIVVLPDISYFDSEHFETRKSQKLDIVNDSDNSDMSFKPKSTHKTRKRSKKIAKSKKCTQNHKSQRMPADRLNFEIFECFQCKKCFKRFSDLQRHASSHAKKEKPYECTECRIQFVYLKSLFRHRRQKHSARVYECEYCTEAFESLSKLKQHVNGAHKKELKTYKCDLCTKPFLLRFQLSCHQSEDLCSQNFKCTTCFVSFPLHRMLKNHIRDKHTSKFRTLQERVVKYHLKQLLPFQIICVLNVAKHLRQSIC